MTEADNLGPSTVNIHVFQVRLNKFLYKIGIYGSLRLSRFEKICSRHLEFQRHFLK